MKKVVSNLKKKSLFYSSRIPSLFKHPLALIVLLFLCFSSCKEKNSLPPGDPDNGGRVLLEGFEALVVADSTGSGRHIAVSDDGDIYIKLRYSEEGGSNVALSDTTADGKADTIQSLGHYEDEGALANGM